MKIDCGPTRSERIAKTRDWHDWFAWFPVRVGSHDCRWLEVVQRRNEFQMIDAINWLYRAKPTPSPASPLPPEDGPCPAPIEDSAGITRSMGDQ